MPVRQDPIWQRIRDPASLGSASLTDQDQGDEEDATADYSSQGLEVHYSPKFPATNYASHIRVCSLDESPYILRKGNHGGSFRQSLEPDEWATRYNLSYLEPTESWKKS
jgi:hypothetical protein